MQETLGALAVPGLSQEETVLLVNQFGRARDMVDYFRKLQTELNLSTYELMLACSKNEVKADEEASAEEDGTPILVMCPGTRCDD